MAQTHSTPPSTETDETISLTIPPLIDPIIGHKLPPFPVGTLPPWLGKFVVDLANATQTPPDMAGMLALSVLSAATRGRYRVAPWQGYVEPCTLFTLTVARSGARKSAVVSRMIAPLEAAEKQAPLVTEGDHPEDIDAPASKKTAPRLIADDITPERLLSLLAENDGRLGIFSAEGDFLQILAGRYAQGGDANLGVVLKAHAGETLRLDRQGRPSVVVTNPALTIGLTVQPRLLRNMHKNDAMRELGLLGRFLYSLPPDMVGHREIFTEPVSEDVENRYAANVTAILDKARLQPDQLLLAFDDDAIAVFADFCREVEDGLQPGGIFAGMAAWGSKLPGAVARIAGLLHVACMVEETPEEHYVTRATVEQAVRIGCYLARHGRAAYESRIIQQVELRARLVLTVLCRLNTSLFDFWEVRGKLRLQIPSTAELQQAFELLVDWKYLRINDGDTKTYRATQKMNAASLRFK